MGYARKSVKRDHNHGEIAAALEAAGAWVQDLSSVGGGCPDMIVKFRGSLYWVEVKNRESKNGRYYRHDGLLDSQVDWLAAYGPDGPIVHVVHDTAEALAAIGAAPEV